MIMTFEEVEPKQKKISQPLSPFSSLPDEITENILARVSRWNYPSLSLVSKRFRSLLSSMEIYKTRSQIGTRETSVYVCLHLPNQPYPNWYSVWSKPNQTLTKHRGKIRFKKDPTGNSVVPTHINYPHIKSQSPTATVGPDIYIIGGPWEEPSSSVWILDCRSHTWQNSYVLVNVTDEKFFVMIKKREYTYDGTWKLLGEQSNSIGNYVVDSSWINNVIYCCTLCGDLFWCDSEDHEGREWREIKGLRGLRDDCKMGLRSASAYAVEDYGGKLMVMWGSSNIKLKNKIRYAKISLERSSDGHEIWGKIECVDELTFPCESYKSFYCLSALV
ncbi:hypothetical protein Bca4012_021261 [Brassica carinata]